MASLPFYLEYEFNKTTKCLWHIIEYMNQNSKHAVLTFVFMTVSTLVLLLDSCYVTTFEQAFGLI